MVNGPPNFETVSKAFFTGFSPNGERVECGFALAGKLVPLLRGEVVGLGLFWGEGGCSTSISFYLFCFLGKGVANSLCYIFIV